MMKNSLKNIILDKRSGDSAYVGLAISFIIFTIFAGVMLFTYMIWMLSMNSVSNIDLILTTYCKRMETQGCLNAIEVDSMKEELKKYGFINVTVSGTGIDGTKQQYGSEIKIEVQGDIDYVNDEKFEGVKNTILYLRRITNSDIGIYQNRDIIKTGISKS